MNAHWSPEVPLRQRPEGRLRADVLNRMHSRGHDLSRTRCRAFPAEAASPSFPSTFLSDLRDKLSFSFASPI
jgi:hypothetical protein